MRTKELPMAADFATRLRVLFDRVVSAQLGDYEINTLGRVVGELLFYRGVVDRVLARYLDANETFFLSMEALEASLAGTADGPMSPEQQRLWGANAEANSALRQEIETFYLFSRILLDKLTHAFYAFLGWGQHAQLSFHGFADSIGDFTRAKGLPDVPDNDVVVMRRLEASIVDWRNKQIVHAKSPRGLRPIGFELNRRESYLIYTLIYPDEQDRDVRGAFPSDMGGMLDDYCARWLAYLERNVKGSK